MRTLLLITAALLTACADDPGPPPDLCHPDDPSASARLDPRDLRCTDTSRLECALGGIYGMWAGCDDPCLELDQDACAVTIGCRIARTAPCGDAGCQAPGDDAFLGCYGIAPLFPTWWIACAGLDAETCSSNDTCYALHDPAGGFIACVDEGPTRCAGDGNCHFDERCVEGSCTIVCPGADEETCNAVSRCVATYHGTDCTCVEDACHCEAQEFVSCEVAS